MFEIDYEIDIKDLLQKEKEEENFSFPSDFVVKSAKSSYIIDENDKFYLDLTSNKECSPLGYSYVQESDQTNLFDSELFKTTDSVELENLLRDITGMKEVIYTSSKFESDEICGCMLKKYFENNNKDKILVSSLKSPKLLENAKTDFIPLNNEIIAQSLLTKSVGAVYIDIAQINNEINIANTEYLTILRNLCTKNNALLAIDASSLSPLRTLQGIFNFDLAAIKPDILIIANSVTHGIPFGALLLSDKIEKPQTNTSATIFAYKSAQKFIKECIKTETLSVIKTNATYFEKTLNSLTEKYITIADVVSYGMLFKLIIDISAYEFMKECFNEGIIVEALNSNTIKLSPPYNISREEIDKLITVFEKVLDKLAKYDRLK